MTEKEYAALLELANAWDAVGNTHQREMRRFRGLADHAQRSGNKERQDFFRAEAVNHEIRAQIFKDVSKVLAVKLGEIQKSQTNTLLKASA